MVSGRTEVFHRSAMYCGGGNSFLGHFYLRCHRFIGSRLFFSLVPRVRAIAVSTRRHNTQAGPNPGGLPGIPEEGAPVGVRSSIRFLRRSMFFPFCLPHLPLLAQTARSEVGCPQCAESIFFSMRWPNDLGSMSGSDSLNSA